MQKNTSKTDKLTIEAEQKLVRAAKNGDESALSRLFEAHRKQVAYLARQRPTGGCPHEDLVQQGFLGLCRAVERYEPERGLRFWTYARWWVRAMVRSYVWSNRRIVPLSSNRTHRHVAAKLRKVESRIGGDRAELAKQLEVSEEDIDRVRQALGSGDVSLDWTVSPAMTPVANDTSPEVEVADGRNQQRREELVGGALDVLDEREREIIERRYLQESPPTLADLGQEMGISRERVRQLCERALGKLKNAVTEEEPAAAALVA